MWNTDFISKDDLQMTVFIEDRNQQSMDYFYDKYSPALYGIIHRIINNKQLAEECLMATFQKAWNEIAAFRDSGTSLFTWLIQMARQSAFELIALEKERNPETQNSVYGPNQLYSAFEQVFIKGLSVPQAAEFLGISEIALRVNIRMELQNRTDKTIKA